MPRPPTKSVPTPDQFVANWSPAVQTAANAMRDLVKRIIPDVQEYVNVGWGLLGYRVPLHASKRAAYFGFLGYSNGELIWGCEFGALMDDPHGLLTGGGSQVRIIRIGSEDQIEPQKYADLLREAVRLATMAREERLLIQRSKE